MTVVPVVCILKFRISHLSEQTSKSTDKIHIQAVCCQFEARLEKLAQPPLILWRLYPCINKTELPD